MDAKAAAKEIKQGKFSPIYCLYGSEKFRMNEFAAFLESELIAKEDRDFAVVPFDLSETPIQAVVEEAETVPFMVPRKLLVVRDASLFTAGKDNAKLEHRPEVLQEYLSSPAEFSVIVFLVNSDKLDERKKIVKALKSAGTVLAFNPLGAEELLRWVEKGIRDRGSEAAPGAAEALIASAGTGLQGLSAEMDKLCLFAGPGGTVDSAAIESLVPRGTEQNVFTLVEDIANLRLDRAVGTLHELLKQREEPIKIAALIARQFRIILQVKDLSSQSYTQGQIASQLGLHPYAVKLAGEQARKFRGEQLREILSLLADLDFQMKTGGIDKVLGLELFMLRLGAGRTA
ncbi:DNA polymerase III subunit delta [Paenibacillus sp. 7124]|uniref:DNA polymerase III subunit delta n=1 Tax=Paenibacillus apii TaxID=1850370 RepID=A0A6M1PF03_9BACL|nr:DNA polymerase III subunit delta [Paenibacillus apii]NGM81857.1 DNA polymerase III subunit delta [Paenibacillus apii]NJJ40984.1 DNA polymerase III subunit delta [Paenibacillus apii]